jgi:NADPH:quinone reductase-like Zn-dependent oxidoreductase
MKAVQYATYGGPDVLKVTETDEPHAGPGQVRVKVQAAGVNPFDTFLRMGAMSGGVPLAAPVTVGVEAAGIVDEIGDGVAGVALGDAVFGLAASGGTAEYAVLSAWAGQPAAFTPAQAGGMTLVVETAARVLRELGVGAGFTVLIHGAGGGVGQAAVQLARELGARVIATAGERNHELLRHLGADATTTYGEGLPERVAALAPNGVDGVFDAAGSQLEDLLVIAGALERLVTIANFAAAARGVRVSGGGERALDALAWAADLADAGRFELAVLQTFAPAETGDAHRLIETRTANGKLVILFE